MRSSSRPSPLSRRLRRAWLVPRSICNNGFEVCGILTYRHPIMSVYRCCTTVAQCDRAYLRVQAVPMSTVIVVGVRVRAAGIGLPLALTPCLSIALTACFHGRILVVIQRSAYGLVCGLRATMGRSYSKRQAVMLTVNWYLSWQIWRFWSIGLLVLLFAASPGSQRPRCNASCSFRHFC